MGAELHPARFHYLRPESVEAAIRALTEAEDPKLLAGGHSLLPMMKLRLAQPATLVDIGRLDLAGINARSDRLDIGALTTHHEAAGSPEIVARWTVVAEAAASIGDPIVRNHGTVGGNLAHADPASDLPAAILAAGGILTVRGPEGSRQIPASSFFEGLFSTAMHADELLTEVSLPAVSHRLGSAYLKFAHPASGFAVCGVAAVIALDHEGKCSEARLCFNGVTETPLDATAVADTLLGSRLDEREVRDVIADCLEMPDPLEDTFASGHYRRHLAGVYGRRAVLAARDRARG